MRIVFCASDKEGHYASGPNAWLQRIIPDLINNYKLNIVPLIFYHGRQEYCPTIQFFKKKKIPIVTLSFDKSPFIEDRVYILLKTIKNLNATVLIANLLAPAYYAAKYLRKSGIITIGVLHSNDKYYSGVIEKFIKGQNQNALDVFVTVSKYILKEAQKVNRHNAKLISIPCGTPNTDKNANPPVEQLNIIYVGRLEVEQKEILKLTKAFIDAARQNQNLQFTIYGSGREKENVVNLISNCQFQNQIFFRGEVAADKIMHEIAKHQVFTLMSDYEGMPVALMEAMACGLVPVCLEEKSGINEIIQHGENGFIVKNRGKDYQEKLIFLQQNPEEWKRMSKNAKKTINRNYSSEITHHQWAELLKSFENRKTKKIKIPFKIKINGEPLTYGDKRRPSLILRLKIKTRGYWSSIRLLIRPRSRLRKLFKK